MKEMTINIKNTTMIQPSKETPKNRMWVSNLDLVVSRIYVPTIYFYRPNGLPGFFDPNLVKEALGRALIAYYPVAGRLRRGVDGRNIEIDCNGEGVLFVEAETTSIVDDFGDFAPTKEYSKLIPSVDCSGYISSSPLVLLQLTYFKCGGVSLGAAMHHLLADGFSIVSFTNAWADIARELDSATTPSIDRTLLRAREPPSPIFQHDEYNPYPKLLTPHPTNVALSTRVFHINRDQIKSLKGTTNYSSFEILSGHIWRCACKARGLSDKQPSKLYIPVDGRFRLKPNLPLSFFGNAIFTATPVASCEEIVSSSTYAASKIHESLARMDDEYLRSALDYIELHPNKEALLRGPHTFKCPNLVISSWAKLPLYDVDFGWGQPIFTGPGWVNTGGSCYLVPRAVNDGGLSLLITLEAKHMQLFETYLYQI